MIQLQDIHLKIVQRILADEVPDYEVHVFGSRVKGTTKRYADLDLVIIGQNRLPLAQLDQLAEKFSESDLPFRVDVLDWWELSDDFRDEIKNLHEIIQKPLQPSISIAPSSL